MEARAQGVKVAPEEVMGRGPCSELRAESTLLTARSHAGAAVLLCTERAVLPSRTRGQRVPPGRTLPGQASLPPLLTRDRPQCGSHVLGNVLSF